MQLHGALLRQKLAVQREIERAERDEEELQHAIDTANGANSGEETTRGSTTSSTTSSTTGVVPQDGDSMNRGGGGQSGLGGEEGGVGGGGAGRELELKRSTVVLSGPLRMKRSENSLAR